MDEHRQWLGALSAGADSGELKLMAQSSTSFRGPDSHGARRRVRRLLRAPAPIVMGAGAAAGLLLIVGTSPVTKEGREVRDRRGRHRHSARGQGLYAESSAHFEAFVPPMPSWPETAEACDPLAVLARACVYALARAKVSDHSAVEVADLIPPLPVAQGSAKVRQVLRCQPCFKEIYRGRWQVGMSIEEHESAAVARVRTPDYTTCRDDRNRQ